MPSDEYTIDRRRTLKTLGAVGSLGVTTSLAGCTGGPGGGGGGGDESGDGGSGDGTAGESGSGGDAEYTMKVATAYAEGSVVPLAQQEFVQNVEEATDGAVTTELYPGGQLSVGSKLASKVQGGSIEVGSVSLSNFSPYSPAVDVINLPYFAGTYQRFVNLVTSDVWNDVVYEKIRENGYEPLFVWLSAPRAVGTREQAVSAPGDVEGLKIRIPSSDLSKKAWNLAGANPTPVGWGETAQAVEEGVVDGVHVSLPPLVAYGFPKLLSHVTSIQMFMDCGIYAMNKQWFDGLPDDLQTSIKDAADQTFEEHLGMLQSQLEQSRAAFEEEGVELHSPSDDELQQWRETVGYQRSEWDETKTQLAGDMATFEKLEQAVETKSDYTV
jgi:TRAP-type C4-dicarboxylate transport system substrate-binding protein